MIRFQCGNCKQYISVKSKHAGKKVKCLGCGKIYKLPEIKSAGPDLNQILKEADTAKRTDKSIQHCPYCQGEVLISAKKCKHCGEWLIPNPQTPQRPSKQQTTLTNQVSFGRLVKVALSTIVFFVLTLSLVICTISYIENKPAVEPLPEIEAEIEIKIESDLPGMIPNVISFSNWEKVYRGYKGRISFHGWQNLPDHIKSVIDIPYGSKILSEYKLYNKYGTVLDSGLVICPTLKEGETGVAEIRNGKIKNASKIIINVKIY
tara:strand:- start:1321 stop:2106 length:786 start_codon:yes stop_codon:yes gene_type:complete